MINIEGVDKAELLAALFNGSQQQGMGFLDPKGAKAMTVEDARSIIDSGDLDFDYLHGRVMKIGLGGDKLDPWLYDRDNGEGAALGAVKHLLAA